MADDDHHHHDHHDHHHNHKHNHTHHRPHRLNLPSRTGLNPSTIAPAFASTEPITSRGYPAYPPTTPTPTPSKHRRASSSKSSLSFLFLLLLSLRSLYSLLPFLQSTPSSFSIFPFSFLVSFLSFLLSLSFSVLASSKNQKSHFKTTREPIFSLSSISQSQHRLLFFKSIVLSVALLLKFQALRYCGTAAMILAELSGNIVARFAAEATKNQTFGVSRYAIGNGNRKLSGFFMLFIGLLWLSLSWDRIDCFPFSIRFIGKYGFPLFPREDCVRIWPMLLPFLSGFLGCYERTSMNWGAVRSLGPRRVRLISLFYTTVLLLIPAVVSFVVFEFDNEGVSIGNLGWPLANTVVFGVLLAENHSDEKVVSSRDLRADFFVTFVCTIVLELFYFPELSLWGLLLCGSLLYFAVRELDPVYSNYLELGLESSEPFSASFMKPIRHILSERKSRKIALFLMINASYMVVEFVAGFMSNSLGLISDACHMLFDCAALAIGLYASYFSRFPANNQFNYGRGRFEVLSGYVNAVFLVLVGALIVLESFERILEPQEISTNSLLTVSIGGLLVNVVGLVFFHEEHHHAHGGSGSCSHSHSDSHVHHQHSLDPQGHGKHHKCISISHDCRENSLTGLENHHDNCNSHDDHDCQNHTHHDHSHNDHSHHLEPQNHHLRHHSPHDKDHSYHEDHTAHHHSQHCHDHVHHDGQNQNEHNCSSHHHHKHHESPRHVEGSSSHTCTDAHHLDSASNSFPGDHSAHQRKLASEKDKMQKDHHHHHIDHNMEGIFLHVLADTMGSVGVVISTLLIKYKGWLVADPASSIFISVLIISSVIPLLRNSAEILLQRVPRAHEQDLRVAVSDVMKMEGVHGIQNLHIWSMTNTDVVGTLHLHVAAEADKASLKSQTSSIFHNAGIKDLTLQVECVK